MREYLIYWPIIGLFTLLFACGGADSPSGLDEPIIVHQGNFKDGALPGKKPDPDATDTKLAITSSELGTGSLRPGSVNVPLSGRASGDTYAIGVSLLGQGSGYWVRPAAAEDPLVPGELDWDLTFDIGADVEPGKHQLGIVAIDKNGHGGLQSATEVCVRSDLPDEGNVCNPSKEPPVAIAALRWNVDSDMDLLVIAPDGTRYSRSKFSEIVNDEVVARLDGDSNSGCQLDGRHGEYFIWSKKPKKGTWYIYANLFDACQKTAVRFELTTYRKHTLKDGTFALHEERSVAGELLRAQAQPSAEFPLYLTKIDFP
jgi:hypothetical protein